jgi:hypothetical protein
LTFSVDATNTPTAVVGIAAFAAGFATGSIHVAARFHPTRSHPGFFFAAAVEFP